MTSSTGLRLAVAGLALMCLPAAAMARSGDVSPDRDLPDSQASAGPAVGRDLFLVVSVNGRDTELVAAFHQDADGTLTIEADQLRNVGILPVAVATLPDGRIRIDLLPGVRFVFDELNQSIAFTADDAQQAPRIIDARLRRGGGKKPEPEQAQSSYGALLNYSLVGAMDNSNDGGRFDFSGLSGAFEARAFGPLGVLATSFIASTSDNVYFDNTRLETTWRYSDQSRMLSYSAGDIITGGLSWTRSTRLGGFQIQRNFALRSDLVTFPVPGLSGSAAVPSTVEVYLNNARRFTSPVDAGPFEITNLPIVDGAGNARIVVTDAQGQEVVSESSFITSNQLLSPGLMDFSAEVGFARIGYGVESNVYDRRPYGSATFRTGITNRLTLEAHAEGGADLINGGGGVVIAAPVLGVVSVSAAGSYSSGERGHQLVASLKRDLLGLHLSARVQRSFGHYQDIASVTAADVDIETGLFSMSADPPRALEQVAVSVPLAFDSSNLNFSYTHLETTEGDHTRIVGVSYNRPVFGGSSFSVSALKDLEAGNVGVYASLVIPIGADTTSATAAAYQEGDYAITERLTRSQGQKIGDYGWSVARQQSDSSVTQASASYRTSVGNITGRAAQRETGTQASLRLDGAVIAAGGGVFFSNRIGDAFAIVDAGAPGVDVQYENRPAGVTDRNGKLLLPRLRSYQRNRISIDPTDLPLDAVVNNTRDVVMPADRSGIVVKFDVDTDAAAALVAFTRPDGSAVEMGAIGRIAADAEPFVVGYDGQALVENLQATNRVTLELQDGTTCVAAFNYIAQPGKPVSISDAICQP
ncbi:outer membrane usher protein [Hoeflea marina]|uniref:Outer membrane usher protein n=1 Tax=Hoeflea marina TaxID=274592 RepID=A0A317PSG5_9HYPH|nr:fimbria/pilus outer membrane usher protein [Hoeflea marina]PWW04402.1 outer membrane usher protein [Hoeflea marina]